MRLMYDCQSLSIQFNFQSSVELVSFVSWFFHSIEVRKQTNKQTKQNKTKQKQIRHWVFVIFSDTSKWSVHEVTNNRTVKEYWKQVRRKMATESRRILVTALQDVLWKYPSHYHPSRPRINCNTHKCRFLTRKTRLI